MKRFVNFLRKTITIILLVILGFGAVSDNFFCFLGLSLWTGLISFALYTKKFKLLKIVACDYPLEKYKPIQAKKMMQLSILILVVGILGQIIK